MKAMMKMEISVQASHWLATSQTFKSTNLRLAKLKNKNKFNLDSKTINSNRDADDSKGSKKKNMMSQSVMYNLSKLSSANMNPMTVMQMDIDSAKQTVDKCKELRSQSDQEHNEEKKLVMLNKENISLRESLKQMNSSLTKFIELLKHFKIKKMGKPKYGIENLSTDYKLRARGAEEKTLNQILQNMKKEYESLKARVEVVGDPGYSIDVRRRITEMKDKIKKLEEERRKLTYEKFHRDKKISKVISAGQPDSMQEIQKKVQELTIIADKMEKINRLIEFQDNTKQDADKQFTEIQQKLQESESKAEAAGLSLDEINNPEDIEEDFSSNLSKDPRFYERKSAIISQAIETDKTMYCKQLDNLKRKLVDALNQK